MRYIPHRRQEATMDTPSSNSPHKSSNNPAPMGMPRSNLMGSVSNREFVTMTTAQGIALVFTILQVIGAALFAPMVLAGYQHAGLTGAQLPHIVRVVQWLNWYGQALTILIVNGLIFWFFYGVSKRSWIGIAFLPSLIYTFFTVYMAIALTAPLLGVF